jgi:hypothetical protein
MKATADEGHGDELVELTRVASAAEALAIKQDLERAGIRATVFASDAGGWAPYLSVYTGNRVMVFATDKAEAAQLLSPTGGLLDLSGEPDEASPPPVVAKHLRHHGTADPQ